MLNVLLYVNHLGRVSVADLVHIRYPLLSIEARLGIYPRAARRSLQPAGARGRWVTSPSPASVKRLVTPSQMRAFQPLDAVGVCPGECNEKDGGLSW